MKGLEKQFVSLFYTYILLNCVVNGKENVTKDSLDLTNTPTTLHEDKADTVSTKTPLIAINDTKNSLANGFEGSDKLNSTTPANVPANKNNQIPENTTPGVSVEEYSSTTTYEGSTTCEGSGCPNYDSGVNEDPIGVEDSTTDSTPVIITLVTLLALIVVCSIIGILVCVLQRRMYRVLHSEITRG